MSVPILQYRAAFLVMAAMAAFQPIRAEITATKDDGVPAATRKNPGDSVTYTNVITNSGPENATGVTFTDPDDPNAPTQPTSVSATAVAVNDTYPTTVLANVGINTSSSSGFNVLSNDFLGVSAGSAVTASSLTLTCDTTSANGGTVSMVLSGANVGTFSYTPAPGFTGTDSFNYVLDSASGTAGNKTGTVTLTVGGPVIWYVNNNAGSAGDGRLASPFNTLAALQAVNDGGTNHPKANQYIFLYESATAYAGPLTLLNGQQLIGQDSTQTLASLTSASTPADSVSLPAVNSGNGTIVKITSAANAVVLNSASGSNTVRGLTIGNTTGSGISGSSFGTLTVADLSFTDSGTRTGQALSLTTGTANGTIANLVSSSATNGISLNTVGGSLTVSAGAMSGLTGSDILISGGNGSLSYAGTLANTAGRSVEVASHTGGTLAFSGAITDSGTGIALSNNGGTVISFTGGITSNTGANTAFSATGGGTVTVTGANNTIGATTALSTTAVNIANTTIGAGGVTFKSVSVNGGANGIVLNTTGSTGGFTLTGNGNTSVGGDNSGGTIQNTTGHGIALTSTTGVSLTNLNIQSTGGSGIDGTGVINFTFANGKINNSGNALYESNISFTNAGASTGNNISGTLSITNSTLTNAFDSGIHVGCDAGTISNATLTGNTITSTTSTATSKGYGINLVGIGSASATASLTKATIDSNTIRNFPSAGGIQVIYGNSTAGGPGGVCGVPNDATNIIAITNNVSRGETSSNRMGTHAISVSISGANSGSRSTGNFNISNNGTVASPIGDNLGHTLLIGCNGYATVTGTVNNNVIVSNNTFASNGISGGNGIVISSAETPDLTLTANNNTISQTDGNGILLVGRGVTGTARFKIQDNTVAAPLTGARPGIRVDAGNASSVDDAVFANISGNTSGGSSGVAGIGVRKQGTVSTTNDFGIQGLTSSPANPTQVEDYLSLQNPNSALGSAATGTKRAIVHSGDNFITTNAVPLLLAEGGVEAAPQAEPEVAKVAPASPESDVVTPATEAPVVTIVPAAEPAKAAPLEPEGLTSSQLQATVEAAVERWRAAGLNAAQVALLRGMRFEVADLPGMRLGEEAGGLVRVDRKAGGNGWFVDATPMEDGEFSGATTRLYTDPTAPAAGRMDLLTAVLHEMGHSLGLHDSYRAEDRDSLMYGYLTKGERRLPAHDQARDAVPHAHPGSHFLTAPISIGTLPAGKSVTITSTVTISSSISVGQISSQGTVAATVGGSPVSVLTDDPNAVGTSNPTVTLIGVPPTFTSGDSATFQVGQAGSFSVTTTGIPDAAITNTGNALPSGVTLTDNGDGTATLGGTPAAGTGGVYSLTFTANNTVAPNATQSFTLTVNEAPTFSSANSATFTVGTADTFTVTTGSYPANAALSLDGGSLPAGVTFTDNGDGTATLAGTPDAGTGGSYSLTFAADNGISPDGSQSFTLTVNQAPAITSADNTTFVAGVAGTFTVTTSGFPANATFGSTGALPTGVTFTDNGDGTATLAGTPGLDQSGDYPLSFTADNGVDPDATQNFTLTVKKAVDHFVVSAPANATAGSSFNVTVTAQDEDNQTVTAYSGTVSFSSTDGQAVLPADTTLTNGTGTFSVTLKTAGSQTVTATDTVLTTATGTSGSIEVDPAAANKLAFSQQPTNAVSQTAISPAMTVRILDEFDNLTSSTADVTMAIGTNPGSGALSGTVTVAAVSGVATFSDLSIDKAGTGYTLAASSDSLTGATSSTFNITAGTASKLAFSQQPTNTVAGVAVSPAVTVRIEDAAGNLTSSTADVTVAIGTNPGSGTLSGTATVAAVSGVATFSDLSIEKIGTGYTLGATSTGLTGATSSTFNITPAAANKLAFSQQPTDAVAGVAVSPAVTVRILDEFDNLTSSTADVTVAIGTNPGSGTLSGTATVAAVSGVATFSDLSIEKTGTGYTLGATSTGLTGATSSAFNITPAAANKLAFSQQPTDAVAGVAVSPAVTVRILDEFDNLTSSTADVTMAIGTNPGSGTLSGTATVAAVSGVATFSDLSIEKIGTGYTLGATSTGLTGATSSAFNITPAAANKLAFSQQPTDAVAGVAVSPAVTVRILDEFDNLTSSTADVTMAIGTNPGSGTLSGTATVAAVSGVATFSDLSIEKTGTGYTLGATSTGLTGATSSAFDITPAAATHFTVNAPANAVAGTAFDVTVTALDEFENIATGYAGTAHFTSSDSPATLPADGSLTNGVGTFSVTLKTGGDQTVTTTDTVTSSITGTSGAISVAPRSDLAVTISDSPDPVTAGTNLTYTLEVVNNGPSAASTVSLSQELPAGTTFVSLTAPGGWTPTTPAVGASGTVTVTKANVDPAETASFTLVVEVAASAANGGSISGTATVSSTTTELNLADNSATTETTVSTQADLALTMTDSPDPANAGTNVSYQLTLTNNGPSDAAGVSISDTLPAGLTYVSSTAESGWNTAAPAVGANGTVTFDVATLAAGASAQFTIVARIDAATATGTVVSNTASAASDTADSTPGNNSATTTTTVSRSADLEIAMTDSPDPVNASQNVTYTIDVTQHGPSDASDVSVSDTLPANTTFVSATATSGWSASTPAVGAAGTITFTKAVVAAEETAQFTIVAKVDLNAPNDSTLSNTATVSATESDPVPANNSATTDTLVKSGADLVIGGSVASSVVAGTDLTYTFTAENHGPLDADAATVTSVLPTGTTFVSATAPVGWSTAAPSVGANGTVTFTKDTFANGASAEFTVVAHVASSVAKDTVLQNTIAAASSTLDLFPLNSGASLESTVTTSADLAVSLAAAPDPVTANSDVTYTLGVSNDGPSDATDAGVSLPLPSAMTFVSASGAGWTVNAPSVGNGGTVTFTRAAFAQGASDTLTVVAKVVSGTANGTILEATATAGGSDTDPVPGNNQASASVAVGTVNPTPLQLTTTATLKPQSGLFELSVDVTNTTPYPINGFRLHVDYSAYKAAYPSLRLYNASSPSGSSDVYVDYPYPVVVDGKVTVKLMFYTSTRTFPSPFSPVLTVETLATSQLPDTNGHGVQPTIRKLPNGTVLLEFASTTGAWYRVRYTSDMVNWYDCPVPIQAGGSRTQWIDDGAPFTHVSPADPSVTSRFYIVNEITAP